MAEDAPPHPVHPSYLSLHLLAVSLQGLIPPVGALLLRVKAESGPEAGAEVTFKVSILLLDMVLLPVLVQAVGHSHRARNNVRRVWKSKEAGLGGKACLVGRQVQCLYRLEQPLEVLVVGEAREAGHWYRPRPQLRYRDRDSSRRIGIKDRVARMCSRRR